MRRRWIALAVLALLSAWLLLASIARGWQETVVGQAQPGNAEPGPSIGQGNAGPGTEVQISAQPDTGIVDPTVEEARRIGMERNHLPGPRTRDVGSSQAVPTDNLPPETVPPTQPSN